MKRFSILLIILGFIQHVHAQQMPRFWDDVQTIKRYDKIYTPPQHPILFIGSSSIRKWDINTAFKQYTVLNRGIGGAIIADIDKYVEDIIVPYAPKQIVLYIGDNDIQNAVNGDSVFSDFKKLYRHIRQKLPVAPVIYISIKPSPSREQFLPIAMTANKLTQQFINNEKNIVYVDAFNTMLDEKGHTRPELFLKDMLHLNEYGYIIWNKLISPFLLKD